MPDELIEERRAIEEARNAIERRLAQRTDWRDLQDRQGDARDDLRRLVPHRPDRCALDAVLLAHGKLTEAITILETAALETAAPAHVGAEENGAEPFRTKVRVKNGGTLLAPRIPTLQPSEGRGDNARSLSLALAEAGLGEPAAAIADAVSGANRMDVANGARLPTLVHSRSGLRGISLDDILGFIRASATSRRTGEGIAVAQCRRRAVERNDAITLVQSSEDMVIETRVGRSVAALAARPSDTAATAPQRSDTSWPGGGWRGVGQLPPIWLPEDRPPVLMLPTPDATAVPPANQVHEQASIRLERLEAEVSALAAPAPLRGNGGTPQRTAASAPAWQFRAMSVLKSGGALPLPQSGEAEVEIMQRAASPVTPSVAPEARAVAMKPASVAVAGQHLEEASVVIVKRPTEASLAADGRGDRPAVTQAVSRSNRWTRL